MNIAHFSRRDFLKLASLASLSMLNLSVPHLEESQQMIAQPQPPNILILVFDALSAHNMSLYGYPRQTTPNLERLAQKATVFHRHYSAGNFTSPGTASLLTGVYPWTHRALSTRSQALERFSDENILFLKERVLLTQIFSLGRFLRTILSVDESLCLFRNEVRERMNS